MNKRLKLVENKLEFSLDESLQINSFILFLNNSPIWSFNIKDAICTPNPAFEEINYSVQLPSQLVSSFYGWANAKLTNEENQFSLESKFIFDNQNEKYEITDLLGRNMFFSKWGFFQTSIAKSSDTKSKIIKSTSELVKFLESKKYQTIITSGTLLGAIRGGRMLPNDDDADIAVIFDDNSPAKLNIKSLQLESDLKKAGYTVFRHSGSHLQIYFFQMLNQTDYYIDIFLGFFKDGNYCQPFHMYHPMEYDDIFPTAQYMLEGVNFPGPKNIDKYFTGLYGPQWETPDNSFHFETPYTVKIKYDSWFGRSMGFYHNYWEQYNALEFTKNKYATDKSNNEFLKYIQKTFDENVPIIDICCGNGELMSKLRGAAYKVSGVDFSYTALYKANSVIENSAIFANMANRSNLLEVSKQINKTGKPSNFIIGWTLNTLDNYIRENIYYFLSIWLKRSNSCLVSFDYETDNCFADKQLDSEKVPSDWVYSLNEFACDINKANLSGEILYKSVREIENTKYKYAIIKITK